MARLLLSALILMYALSSQAQNNCLATYQYTLGLCPNILFFSNIQSEDIDNANFHWDFGDGTTSTDANPEHLYTASGFYEVCLTVELNGCTSSFCSVIGVQCIQDNSCHASYFQYSYFCGEHIYWSNSFSTGTNEIEHQWSFGDGGTSSEQGPTHQFTQNGTYEVCVTISDASGCSDTYCETLIIDCFPDPPVCETFFQYTLGACPVVHFFGSSTTPPPGTTNNWEWDFGDGTTGSGHDPVNTYAENGIYTVCLVTTAPDGCVAEHCETIHITCIPSCEISFEYTLANCPVVEFIGATTSPPPGDLDWVWHFGDGSTGTGPNPLHTYTHNDIYTVCLTTTDPFGCTAEYCEIIEINCIPPTCEAFFQYTLGLCPEILFFGSSNTPAPLPDTEYAWDFGDGSTSEEQNPSHTYSTNGTYIVCLIITTADGCVADHCETITINCIPDCDIAFQYTLASCPTVEFFGATTTPPPGNDDWFWQFGDGSTGFGPNPVHTYEENGIFNVCLTTVDPFGCTATYCEIVEINCIPPSCEAFFQYTLGACPEIHFFGVSNNPSDPLSWFWDFGDGSASTEQNPVYDYPVNGTYNVCLTIATVNGCFATYCETITIPCIPPSCEAFFQYTLGECPVVHFSGGSSIPPPGSDIDWQWSFGDGSGGTGPNPVHTYAANGTYTVCLVVTDATGCVSEYCEEIVINCIPPSCEAFFEYTLDDCPLVHFFSANSNPPPGTNAWHWDFGDGSTGIGPNPVHTYEENGFYEVCLTVIHSANCTATYCEEIPIKCIATGIDEAFTSSISVYPNPVNDFVQVRMDRGYPELKVSLRSIEGKLLQSRLIYSQSEFELDLEELASGMYLLTIKTENRVATVKLIKE